MAVKLIDIELLRLGRADPAVLMQEDDSMSIGANEALDLVGKRLIMGYWSCRFGLWSEV